MRIEEERAPAVVVEAPLPRAWGEAFGPLRNVKGEVRIVEVGPRDGLQNHPVTFPTETKRRLVEALFDAGLPSVEVTSFVRPDRIPQLADADELFPLVLRPDRQCLALVANRAGLERATKAGARAISLIAAASDGFSRANTGRDAAEGLRVLVELARAAKMGGVWVRGYVSTCFRCPYDGDVPRSRAIEALLAVAAAGVDEVVVSDTLGDADPRRVVDVCGPVLAELGAERVALHLHDTYELAMANLLAALELGVRTFDGSVAGLGGCPFAPGARGNVATEKVVLLCERLGLPTGVSRAGLERAAAVILGEATDRPDAEGTRPPGSAPGKPASGNGRHEPPTDQEGKTR
ncbi:MAG TPA: hydroxymethylglutaryl-CoA lyase [Chloroflexota bacterium]|nr:hydroxymethylglutaryl-CoA lyase [Chloroflexota bacterium]